MVRTVADRCFLRNVTVRINHLVRTVAKQELGLNIPGGLAHHIFCPVLLEQRGDFQTALKIRPDTHKADVKVANPDTLQYLHIGTVPDLGAGHNRHHSLHIVFLHVDDHHLVFALHHLPAQMLAEPSKPYY